MWSFASLPSGALQLPRALALWPHSHRGVFSGQPTALCLSLHQNNPTLDGLLTSACRAGAKPQAFPRAGVAAAFQFELEDLGDSSQVRALLL